MKTVRDEMTKDSRGRPSRLNRHQLETTAQMLLGRKTAPQEGASSKRGRAQDHQSWQNGDIIFQWIDLPHSSVVLLGNPSEERKRKEEEGMRREGGE